MTDQLFTEADVIYTYTRKQAVADGDQMELTGEYLKMARECYKYPVYLTGGVVNLIEMAVASEKHCNDWNGVLWDILWMSRHAGQRISHDTTEFKVIITGTGRKRYHRMIIQIGPTDFDDHNPALTIMLPEEM